MVHLGHGKDGNKVVLSELLLYGTFCLLRYTGKWNKRILDTKLWHAQNYINMLWAKAFKKAYVDMITQSHTWAGFR